MLYAAQHVCRGNQAYTEFRKNNSKTCRTETQRKAVEKNKRRSLQKIKEKLSTASIENENKIVWTHCSNEGHLADKTSF